LDARELDHRAAYGVPRIRHSRSSLKIVEEKASRYELSWEAFMGIINFNLLKHPMNWVIVTLMVLIAGIAAHFILQFGVMKGVKKPATS
jgi:hypothetical protein